MKYLFLSILSFCIAPLQAQNQQQKWNRQMQLISCSIIIKSGPVSAKTFIEMEFYNPNGQELEGLHQFKLDPGQVITAFQLDLNGKYRDGTIEEKWKATNAYNRIVGKRIDPALLTMDHKNHYSLRIYPVPPGGSRKITFTIEQMLTVRNGFLQYSLPLRLPDTVKKMNITILTPGKNEMPLADPGLIAGQTFSSTIDNYQLEYEARNAMVKGPVSFSIPFPKQNLLCSGSNGSQKNFAVLFQPGPGNEGMINPRQLTIFWDASASAKARDLNKEMMFLQQFIAKNSVEKVTVIPFNYRLLDSVSFYPANGGISGLKQYLRSMIYDGPTQLGCIRIEKNKGDLFMLFTDGNNSYGNKSPDTNGCLIFCINSLPMPDLRALQSIAGTGGGKVINLKSTALNEALNSIMLPEIWLLEIRSASGKIIMDQSLPLKIEPYMLFTGSFGNEMDTLFFYYGNSSGVKIKKEAMSFSSVHCGDASPARVSMLQQFDKVISSDDWEQILDLGIHEKVVTPNTAYIVLERIEDYIRYNIEAPEELKAECELLQYVKTDTRTIRQRLQQKDEFNILTNVVTVYNQRLKKMAGNVPDMCLDREDPGAAVLNTPPVVSTAIVQGSSMPDFTASASGLQDVVVVGYSAMQKRSMTGAVTYVHSNELQGAGTIEQALQGRVPGLTVTQNTSAPGSGSGILIRGISSLSGNNAPLYILDGIPVSGDINDLVNVNHVSNITVLRDVQAAALYGSRAANGAIVIQTRAVRNYPYNNYHGKYRLKDMEDVAYMQEMNQVPLVEKVAAYERMRIEHGTEPGFYFDIAEHFFVQGLQKQAFEILLNAAEAGSGRETVQHAIAYVLESWKMYKEAINVYKPLIKDNPRNLSLHRDLAWVNYQDGNYQAAVDILYDAIKTGGQFEAADGSEQKATMLYEMNEIIAMHRDSINILRIPPALVKSYPGELRIVLDCNRNNFSLMKVIEPGGKMVTENKISPLTNGFIYGSAGYYYGGNKTMVYQAQNAKPGKYKVRVNFYGYPYLGDAPSFIRVKTFKHFGKPNQTIEIENVIMDNQYGEIEIAVLDFNPIEK